MIAFARGVGLADWLANRGIAPSSFLISSGIVIAFVLLAILAPVVITGDPFANNFAPQGGLARYQLPSWTYLFGTNVYGQDVFRQTILGAQRTLIIGFVSGAIVMIVSTLIGTVSGYFAGITDAVL